MSRVPGPHWSSAPSLHGTDSDFVSFQRHLRPVFSESVFYPPTHPPPKKKKTTLYLSSVKSHFFSSLSGSQTEPRHAFPMKGKSAVSKLRATSRQIKAPITATKLEGGEWLPALDTRPPPVVLTPYNSRQQNTQVHSSSRCFGSVCIQVGSSQGFTRESSFPLAKRITLFWIFLF